MAEDGVSKWYVVAGIAAGTALGVAVALLLTRESGEDTRKRIAEAAERLRQQAERLAAQVKETAGRVMEEQKSRLAEALEAGRQTAAEKREELERRLRETG
jgi:gas vesicle protein